MAYGNPGNPGGGEDYYDDSTAPSKPSKKGEEEKGGEETYLLPKSVLYGKPFKPGDELVLEVVRIMDDQVELKYAHGKDEKEDESHEDMGGEKPNPGGMAKESEGEMASMMY